MSWSFLLQENYVLWNFFAGDPNIVCSYPVMWYNMELDQIQNEQDSQAS